MLTLYITYFFNKINFYKFVLVRFFIILFRKNKKLLLLHLDYENNHLFENSYVVVNYRFRNALYYKFGNHKTLEKQIKIFNLKNFENEFDLIVYGFFRKKRYKLKFEPNLKLNTADFKTSISNITIQLEEKNMLNLSLSSLNLEIKKPNIKHKKISITNRIINIKNKPFNQNEFI